MSGGNRDSIDEILLQLVEECTNVLTEWEPSIRQAAHSIRAELIRARINSLLDLEQWAKLHDLDRDMILDGIEHMCRSLLQVPDQPNQDHADRIKELKEGSNTDE